MTFVYLDMRSRGPGNSEVTVETGVIIGAQPAVLLANLVSGGGDTPPPTQGHGSPAGDPRSAVSLYVGLGFGGRIRNGRNLPSFYQGNFVTKSGGVF